jgi:hypothetical protein
MEESRRNAYFADMSLAEAAWDKGDFPLMDKLLQQHVPRVGETDLRNWEWHYQWRLCHNALRTFQVDDEGASILHAGQYTFSPDGRRLAFADIQKPSVFDIDTGQCVATISLETDRLQRSGVGRSPLTRGAGH